MELEFGLKITQPTTDITSESIETAIAFVLLVHLSGFRKDDIEISMDEERMKISISSGGGRSIREHIISARVTICRELEISRFRKSYPIPDGVILEQIEARFDEENEILCVFMPREALASGNGIEQVKKDVEEEEVLTNSDQEEDHKSEAPLLQGSEETQNDEIVSDHDQDEMLRPEPDLTESELKNGEGENEEDESVAGKNKIPESDERDHRNSAADGTDKNPKDLEPDAELDRSDSDKSELGFREEAAERSGRGQRRARGSRYFPISPPCIWAGSAFILSVLALVIHLLRNRRR